MNEELWKNKEYVELIKKAFKKIDEGIGTKFTKPGKRGSKATLDLTLANRAKSVLLAQPDLAFLPKLKEHITSTPGVLAHILKQHESQLLRAFQFVSGMEGHHYLHQNVMQWFKDVPIEKALQVMKRFRDEGGTSGAVFENLFPLSRRGHTAGNLLSDEANRIVSAHLDPISGKSNPAMFAKGFDRPSGLVGEGKEFISDQIFKADDSIEFMVDTIKNYAYDPGKRMTEIAAADKVESTARKFLSKLAGVDLEAIDNPDLVKKYQKILSSGEGWNLNLKDMVEHLSKGGKLPDLDKLDMEAIDEGRGGLFKLLAKLKSNPNIPLAEISKELNRLNKLKPALKTGGKLPVAGKYIKGAEVGLELLTGIPVLADVTREVKTPFEKYYEDKRSNLYDLANVADAAALGTGLASIPSGGMSVLPSVGFGLLGNVSRALAEGHRDRHEEIFYRFIKPTEYLGDSEIKAWDPKQENIDESIEAFGNYAF